MRENKEENLCDKKRRLQRFRDLITGLDELIYLYSLSTVRKIFKISAFELDLTGRKLEKRNIIARMRKSILNTLNMEGNLWNN